MSRGSAYWIGAQRLSASQRGALYPVGDFESCGAGAQRLSASQRGALDAGDDHACLGRVVLNAFRHHRGGHTVGVPVANRYG